VFLHPEQNLWALGATGGAFSGTVHLDPDRGPLVFYTERQAAWDLYKDYREIQKLAVPTPGLVRPRSVQTILDRRPQGVRHDFPRPEGLEGPRRLLPDAARRRDRR
jgi:beta-fructofuranosidase